MPFIVTNRENVNLSTQMAIRSLVSAMTTLAVILLTAPGLAQERLSLDQAVAAVLAGNPDVRVSRAAEAEAAERVPQARAGFLPRVDVSESWQRGNQPVFVFGSLLAQRQFSESNFLIDQLNHPDATANFRTAVTLEQVVFDGGRTSANLRAATLGYSSAQAAGRQTLNDLELAATRAYGQVLLARATRSAAVSAVAAAEEDARTAGDRRDAGVGTEADALAFQVHLAQMRERAIKAASDEVIARAELNRLMGIPLDRRFELDEPASVQETTPPTRAALEEEALVRRPEMERAVLARDLARAIHRGTKAAWLPQVVVRGAYEWNGGSFGAR
ncbi:MAG TPA: TolC family protein, partial [Longimicrobiales bacterium]|nr:TolC family protein [Longimicrobiales bacterium]